MEDDKKTNIFFGLVLLIFSILPWILYYRSGSYYMLFLALFASLIGLYLLLNPFKEHMIIKIILEIIKWIIGIVYALTPIILSFLLISISAIIVLELFGLIFRSIISMLVHFDIIIYKESLKISALYCSALFSLVTLSYFGENILGVIHKVMNIGVKNENELPKKIALWILGTINIRRRLYELSLILYILAVIENLSEVALFTIEIWGNYKPIALEVLVTFVAIDGYVSNFLNTQRRE